MHIYTLRIKISKNCNFNFELIHSNSDNLHSLLSLTHLLALFVSSLFPHTSPLTTNHLTLIPPPSPPTPPSPSPSPFPIPLPHSSSLLHIPSSLTPFPCSFSPPSPLIPPVYPLIPNPPPLTLLTCPSSLTHHPLPLFSHPLSHNSPS